MDESTKLVAATAAVLAAAGTAAAHDAVLGGVVWVFAVAFFVTLGFGLWHVAYTTVNTERRSKRLDATVAVLGRQDRVLTPVPDDAPADDTG